MISPLSFDLRQQSAVVVPITRKLNDPSAGCVMGELAVIDQVADKHRTRYFDFTGNKAAYFVSLKNTRNNSLTGRGLNAYFNNPLPTPHYVVSVFQDNGVKFGRSGVGRFNANPTSF